MSATKTTTQGMLFDMDGTLLDSTPAVLATWEFYAKEYNLDLTEVLRTSHGVRTIDNLRNWCGITDEKLLEEGTKRFEGMIVSEAQRLQSEGKRGLQILPGVTEMLDILRASPKEVWAIVTSATITYAGAALPTAGIKAPASFITAGDVSQGKPHPEPYITGAKAIGVNVKECIVIEDAPSGIRSGVAAGSRVLAVCTSHERSELEGVGATWIVTDLSKVKTSVKDGIVHLEIDESP